MTAGTTAFAVKDGLAPARVTHSKRRARPVEAGADKRHQPVQFSGLQPERRHTCGGNAVGDGVTDVIVRGRTAELVARQIYAIDAVAVLAMADGALQAIQPAARLNVRGTVLQILLLRRGGNTQRGTRKRDCSE